MTYAAVVASSAPCKTQRPIETNGPATIKGVLTMKIGNQTISTIIMIPSEGQAKIQGLLNAQTKLCKALYTMFRITKDPTTPPTPTPVIAIWVATTKKPLSRGTGHNVMPYNLELKRMLICHHCRSKGHYARNCCTRRKELKNALPIPTAIHATITNKNRYKELTEVKLKEAGPTQTPSHLSHTNSLRCPALGSGLDLVSPHSQNQTLEEAVPSYTHAPATHKGSTLLDAKRINQLIAENVTRYSLEERLRVLAAVSGQMKKLP
jgi:hypothetical protein